MLTAPVVAQRHAKGAPPGGNQLYRASIDSGPAAVATAGPQGNGTIVSSALEQSNVQIAQEFIDLISTQRSFQANARVITASDSLLGDLITSSASYSPVRRGQSLIGRRYVTHEDGLPSTL